MASRGNELADAIRVLAMDAVQRAGSGHPGAPMGMADIAEVLWNRHLSHNPANPDWPDRDRFILSNGHGSMLLYALLHLTGYDLPVEELRNFRQLGSKTPGHPEYGCTPGVETTTGPLGQGLANGVGMAIAERVLAARFNRDGYQVVDHHTYVFVGDGCLMEGISHEACSLAGILGLGKLIVFYDDNGISIDGEVEGWYAEDTPARFRAYGWQVVPNVDGHDAEEVDEAIATARKGREQPTLICCRTVIGKGAPNLQGSARCHGSPLGEEEVAATREALNWEHPPFVVPDDIRAGWDAREAGAAREVAWGATFADYREQHPELAAEFERCIAGRLPEDFEEQAARCIATVQADGADLATRKASQSFLEYIGQVVPELLGGSADLSGSNLTLWSGSRPLTATEADANYIHYGVREFAMVAVMNGIALHRGLRPYGGTFLVFMEYAHNAVRLAALSGVPSILVFSHDSVGLGEDGPTHQPLEQLAALRFIPGLSTWRPCDATETAVAWRVALGRTRGPTALVLSRQTLRHQRRNHEQMADIERGGYVLRDCDGEPEAIVIATGSEVAPAVAAVERLEAAGRRLRVVSMPSVDRFEAQDQAYRDKVLPPGVRARLAVEAAHPDYWSKFVGLEGAVIGLDRFGESAPGAQLLEHLGFGVDNIVNKLQKLLP